MIEAEKQAVRGMSDGLNPGHTAAFYLLTVKRASLEVFENVTTSDYGLDDILFSM